jgi:hypothetical protein
MHRYIHGISSGRRYKKENQEMILEIIVTLGMGAFAGVTFLMSHEHSKSKYNYGKNERTVDENERGGNVRNGSSNTTRTYTDRHIMSKLHEEKTTLLQYN